MFNRSRFPLTALFMSLALLGLPLRAQLDPKLQGTQTDFLNLYQQSTNTKVKPEVLTIFDFSGSMAALMYHPLFVNNDAFDNDANRYMDFTLNPGSAAIPGNNVYTVTATADGCAAATTSVQVTVNADGTATWALGANAGTQCGSNKTYTITATQSRCTSCYTTFIVTVNSSGSVSGVVGVNTSSKTCRNGSNYTYTISNISVSSGTLGAGNTVTFSATDSSSPTDSRMSINWTDGAGHSKTASDTFSWSVPNPNYNFTISNIGVSPTTIYAGTTITFSASVTTGSTDKTVQWKDSLNNTSSGATWSWKVPAYNPGTAAIDPYVTATLDPRKGSTAITGITYLTSVLTNGTLIKPNGDPVTLANASAASSSSGLHGASFGASDVRNWVRAASHVRFSTTIGTDTRTIDIPIPWKITTSDSTGNPLSSQTVHDQEIKVASDGTTTTYGSGQDIDMDQNWSLDAGDDVLGVDNYADSTQTQTHVTLDNVYYKAGYVSWLFNGKYADGSYKDKYVIFDAATPNLAGGQGNNISWGKGYGADAVNSGNTFAVPTYNLDGTYKSETMGTANVNIVPALSRVQAVKRAAIQTWVKFQADVLWAFRFLDKPSEASSGSATKINNSSSTTFNNGTSITTYKTGTDSGWTVLNNTSAQGITSASGNSVTGMNRIAKLFAGNNTPLTYAMARGLLQFTDPTSVFNAVETGSDAPSQCMNHFLILFTDGVDNNGGNYDNTNGDTPYIVTADGISKLDAVAGNKAIMNAKTNVDRYGTWWNLFTFAGIGAHLGDSALGTVNVDYMPAIDPGSSVATSAVPSTFLPYSLYKRNATTFTKPHLVTTMTVGVGLGGKYSDTSGPKHSMFLAAAVGDPTLSTWPNITTLQPFVWDKALNSGNGGRVPGSIYYFDGNNPDALSDSLDKAIRSAVGASNINTISNPNTPFIGAALSGEIFIGKFQPPPNGGAVWAGDLLMFGTRLVNDQLQILDTSGNVTTTVDETNAQWSTVKALAGRSWKDRKLYTRVPGSSTTPDPGLSLFTYTGSPYTASTTGLQYIACRAANNPNRASYAEGSAAQQKVIQWVMGGDTTKVDSNGVATANRSNIMGDIIDSSPAVLEYKYSDVSSGLTSALSGVGGTRFRLILVGTNQGWLHAFGEVTKQENAIVGNTSSPVIAKGQVDELWAFMPTDFLGYLDQLTVTNNPHRFMTDGAPAIYHLDLPPTGGGAGDGVVEVSSSPGPERAMVIFGLGKGGRSYYAIDIHDPYNPVLKWSLVPDEATLLDGSGASVLAARILDRPGAPSAATVAKVVKNLGYSTCTPGIARIQVTDSSGKAVLHDAVFLGGGFSVPDIEANFLDANSKPTPLGRSVIALDVYTGKILAAVDLTSSTTTDTAGQVLTPGPVARGLVPFEFILNSGMAQRAYFLDFWGGLWSWGCQKTDSSATIGTTTNPNPTYQYRYDSSDLTSWTSDGTSSGTAGIRLVAKDMSGALQSLTSYSTTQKYYSEALYSTLPAPFRVGSFPGKSKNATGPVPATVGIAIESGNKDNPLDYVYTGTSKPSHHRLSVIFDRQDSAAWSTAANPIVISSTSTSVLDAYPSHVSYQAGDGVITPGNASYYLAPSTASNTKFGYFLNFPDIDTNTKLIPKGINSPLVVSGSLFYSYFLPTEADPCTGGSGFTYTNLICDVINPIVVDNRTNQACTSGNKYIPIGVASDFIALGTRGAIQIGTKSVPNPQPGSSKTALQPQTITGRPSTQYPKARVWRTVH